MQRFSSLLSPLEDGQSAIRPKEKTSFRNFQRRC
jgi:hypothetical protein